MEQSHKAAEPLKPIKPAALIRALEADEDEMAAQQSPEAEANRQRAASEISMIFELKESTAFKWYQKEFVERLYLHAFNALRSPDVKPEDLQKLQTTYLAMREVKAGMLEREITHREQLNPKDEEIPRLRDELARL